MTAGILTIIGMGSVFVFLGVLVLVMMATRHLVAFINRFYPERETVHHVPVQRGSDDEIAVAVAAVRAHISK